MAEPPALPEAERPQSVLVLDSRTVMQAVVVFAVVLGLLWVGRPFLIPLAVAILVWTLLNGLSALVRRIPIAGRHMPGPVALAISGLVIALAVFSIYRLLASQVAAFVEVAPQYDENLRGLIANAADIAGLDLGREIAQLRQRIDVPNVVSAFAAYVGTLMIDIVWVGIYVAFLLVEQKHFHEKLARLRPGNMEMDELEELIGEVARKIQMYLWIKTLMSTLTAVVSYVVMWSFDLHFAPLWALLIFFLNYIPNIGSFVAVAFPVALSLIQFDNLAWTILLVIALGATQFVIGNIVEPTVAGRTLNLSALVIILSLTFWGMIWGVAGMVLCVPITVALVIVCAAFPGLRWIAVLLSSDGNVDGLRGRNDRT